MIHFGEAILGPGEAAAVQEVMESGRLTRGPWCEVAERSLADITGQRCRVVSSGTTALHLALLAAGVRHGDEVILPATSFVATANAVLYCGAKPVFVDIGSSTWTINHERAIEAVTPRTTAILPVNLYGTPPPAFGSWQRDHFRSTGRRVAIIEDNAEGLGARRSGVPAVGDLTTYSFYGSKTVTCGEGGAVGCNDELYAARIAHLSGQAQTSERYVHDAPGYNYRLTELQAAVLAEQLDRLDAFLAIRRRVFSDYLEYLPHGFVPQVTSKDDDSGVWAFAVRKPGMDAAAVIRRMHQAGIETRPVFPPMQSHKHLRVFSSSMCSVARTIHFEGIVLPTHCGLSREDVREVCRALARESE